ncbi:MAG TPA: hypothetical protein VK166_03430 [Chitinophagaceae bacterium]|nr:hypothetical protein [Chitinophagaceae bacterium]
MKRSVLKPIAAGIALALLIFFMPFILVGALMFLFTSFIFFRLFFARKMRKAYAARMRTMSTDGLRSRNYRYDAENQVIYLSPKNFK